jgi:NitT/TauT family transport system substrate-binding protein
MVKAFGAAAGAACMAGLNLRPALAEPPPEVGRIRLVKASLCSAPLYVAEDLLHTEGFSEVHYLDDDPQQIGTSKPVATGAADLNLSFGLTTLLRIERGEPVVMLGGIHTGCYELFGTERIRSILDLRGRRVAVPGPGSTQHLFLSIIASYVGMDPHRDIEWVTLSREDGMQHLAQGKVDAFLGFPPDPQQLRARHIGHTLLNSSLDKPWSQYFCCMVIGNRDFVRQHPIATRRTLRALLKATDLCATQPERSAQFLVDRGYAANRDDALATLSDVRYRSWREYNPEDSVRFFALRLRDTGMIKSTPQRLLEQGTDWRLFNELKRELKA